MQRYVKDLSAGSIHDAAAGVSERIQLRQAEDGGIKEPLRRPVVKLPVNARYDIRAHATGTIAVAAVRTYDDALRKAGAKRGDAGKLPSAQNAIFFEPWKLEDVADRQNLSCVLSGPAAFCPDIVAILRIIERVTRNAKLFRRTS